MNEAYFDSLAAVMPNLDGLRQASILEGLVPLRLGQLGVGSHECFFDWLIQRDVAEPNSTCAYAQRSKLHLQVSLTTD